MKESCLIGSMRDCVNSQQSVADMLDAENTILGKDAIVLKIELLLPSISFHWSHCCQFTFCYKVT